MNGRIRSRFVAFLVALVGLLGLGLVGAQTASADTYTWSTWRTCYFISDTGNVTGRAQYRVNIQRSTDGTFNRVYALGYRAVDTNLDYVSAKDYNGGGALGYGQGYHHTITYGNTWYPGQTTTAQFHWVKPNSGTTVKIGIRALNGDWCYATYSH